MQHVDLIHLEALSEEYNTTFHQELNTGQEPHSRAEGQVQ